MESDQIAQWDSSSVAATPLGGASHSHGADSFK